MKTFPKTGIEYLDRHCPITTGCSNGCPYCWARPMATRFGRSFASTFHPELLDLPASTKKPCRVGVSFGGDLFDPSISYCDRERAFDAAGEASQHTYLFLTKWWRNIRLEQVPDTSNIWLGVSVADVSEVDDIVGLWRRRRSHGFNHAHLWVSVEPILSGIPKRVGIDEWMCCAVLQELHWAAIGALTRNGRVVPPERGGTKPEWVNEWLAALYAAGVPVFIKNNLMEMVMLGEIISPISGNPMTIAEECDTWRKLPGESK